VIRARTVGEWRTTDDGRRIWWVTVLPPEHDA